MRKIQFVAALVFLLFPMFLMPQMSFAQVYKWVDEKGVTHFTDDMTQVPRQFQPKAERIEVPPEKEDTKMEGELTPNKKEDTQKDGLGRGEDYWKGRVQEWRNKLKAEQDKLGALRAKYNGLTEKYNDSRSTAERANLRRERDQVKTEIDQCNSQIEEAKVVMEKKIPEEAEFYKAKPEWIK
ncbi:MAG TPA: DUF4124 domain-containing protein [Thermodesulfobacteriota bacterium]|nr:DUF4124 domain-containing protein [Thermodesulfobacteriota bacterium]